MAELPRLNGLIRALEKGEHCFSLFTPISDTDSAIQLAMSKYDGCVFEGEHLGWDIRGLRDSLQYSLNRGLIVKQGSVAPSITPLARIPANGVEMNQFLAKQALDVGCYGVVFPHISTVEEAYNAVRACRYPRLKDKPLYEPAGIRGDGPVQAARYWGISQQEYYDRADVWPLNPQGEILVAIMIEEKRAIANLPKMLEQVPGIGVVLIGEGDLSQDLGYPRQYEHPTVASAIEEVLAICKQHNVVCGHPHVNAKNVEGLLAQGFRWLMPPPVPSFAALELGRKASGRA